MGSFRRISSRAIRSWSQMWLWFKGKNCTALGWLSVRFKKGYFSLLKRSHRGFVLDGILRTVFLNRFFANDADTDASRQSMPRTVNCRSSRRSVWQTLLDQSQSKDISKRVWLSVLLSALVVGACFGQRFYSQPTLDIKAIAPQTFYAPASATFEDKTETERRRSAVREGAVPLLKVDDDLTNSAFRSLETMLAQGRELRARAGSPPFINLEVLSRTTQDFLFQASEAQWQAVWQLAAMPALSVAQLDQLAIEHTGSPPVRPLDRETSAPSESVGSTQSTDAVFDSQEPVSLSPRDVQAVRSQLKAFSPEQLAGVRELVAHKEATGEESLARLKVRVSVPRAQYRRAAAALAEEASTEGQPLYNYRLFELSEAQWLQIEQETKDIFSEMMLQGIPQGMPSAQLQKAIEARVENRLPPELGQLTTDVLIAAAAPNLVVDEEGTRDLAERAMEKIAPAMISVQQGDLIVMDGEVIAADDFAILDYFGLTKRYFNWMGLSGFSALAAAAIAFYLWIDHSQANHIRRGDHVLVMLLCLVVALLSMLGVPAAGLPLVGLLIGSFYGASMSLAVVVLLVLLLLSGTLSDPTDLLSGAAAAAVGAWIAPQLRAREEFALLGGFVGLAQGSVHLVLTLMRSTAAAPLWNGAFVDSALHGLYGIAWSIVALGVSPYLEHFFDVITPIRLAELANPNRPLLKRLSTEAPGTFQHTMFVANLAEAAARALGRNVELVRAGTLYHDIGKMHDPQGFIENQMGGPNKHDEIDDPWLSASIIKKHVTQGIVMARKYRLPKAVQAFIPEHQGDMKISYFYQAAKERQRKEPSLVVNEADFTYDGPTPQSPETGITMLADSCEAALRSLTPEASIDDAYKMVDKILRSRWRERQLADSGLSREDMDVIASVFIQVWQQHNHKRIAYPK